MISDIDLRTYIENYIQKSLKKRNKLETAAKVSFEEVLARVEDFVDRPNSQNLVILLRGMTTSGIFVTRSFLRFLVSHAVLKENVKISLSEKEIDIFEKVKKKESLNSHEVTPKEVFQAIFKNLLIQHESKEYQTTDHLDKFESTIVLISGVLNEIFSNAAFERGAKHLTGVLGNHYISPKVYGTKSVRHNSELLKNQLLDYINDNPDEKLWLVAFSKGGIDCLHFLKNNNEFANNHISGISTIASPILGTDHLNHRILKFINSIHNYSDSQVYQFFQKQSDVLFSEFQKSLSQERQKSWFSKNHESLPKLRFYTALAMEASWNESHFWMMLTKAFFQNRKLNDGIVIAENALFPSYFDAHNFGIIKGHHLIGSRSSTFNQEALLEAHVLYLQYMNLLY